MGATTFITTAKGHNSAEAFRTARSAALHEEGHFGYTGTIAEKSSHREIAIPSTYVAADFAKKCLLDEAHWCQDKWGPAGAIRLGPDEWLFFGWASE